LELYIIRHAQSTNNALPDEIGRHYDPPLTELGKQQAQIVADHLANGYPPAIENGHVEHGYGLTKLYCSAMHRAMQTAQPIAKALGLVPEIWLDIHEQGGLYLEEETGGYVGYPGKTRAEILAEFQDYLLPEAITEQGWWTGTYEEGEVSYTRALRVASNLRERSLNDERVGIVTHGTFADSLLKAMFGHPQHSQPYYHHYNTAITRVDFYPDFIMLRYHNRITHLPPELVTH
jgi:2,3-bisphosphoglycerate-dependent phosphoglycerate mutase